MSQPELAPGGMTWDMAMAKAGEMLASLPADLATATMRARKVVDSPEYVNARAAAAQAYISFARELTMHGRALR